MNLKISTKTLELKHTWTISRGSSTSKTYNFIELEAEGVTGLGEAAHNVRYDESLESIHDFLENTRPVLASANPMEYFELGLEIAKLGEGQQAAKAAIDIALMDWNAKKLGVPLYRVLGLRAGKTPLTSYSIGIDTLEVMQQKIIEARDYPLLKIKLGGENDEAIMQAVREVTNKTIRVDANEGWRDRNEALEKITWLAQMGVEFVEQPMPANRLEDIAWLRQRSPLPLVADEDVKTAKDIPALAQAYDGINIKIMKSGGLQEAWRMILLARSLGLKIMLGCMVESALGITAAAHLSPLVDWADLDGNLLIKNDPYQGSYVSEGKIILPNATGIGVQPTF
ncbi:MAG: dipeptide epimerase [Deferribacteres bacterium]|nr:dipeptide epimerase [candidate division KSB1 bacterium]MCB9501698.1 dipeptide epimerase [Deferribacteres bacterium]